MENYMEYGITTEQREMLVKLCVAKILHVSNVCFKIPN